MAETKKVVIRTTTGVELDLEFCENTKIIDLKKEIEKVHPQKPKPEMQRLICAGKQAKDEQTVESFVEQSNVVHLVLKRSCCAPSHEASTPISRQQDSNPTSGNNLSTGGESGVQGQSSEMTAAIEQFLRDVSEIFKILYRKSNQRWSK